MTNHKKEDILKAILEDIDRDINYDKAIDRILDKKFSKNIDDEKILLGQKAADTLASGVGSWFFIIAFISMLMIWIIINSFVLKKSFDPYPFILLNLMLSCLAAIQAPIIMMSQNRQASKDREQSENDYRVNLKTEIIIEDMHYKLDRIIENQGEIFKRISELEIRELEK